MVLFSLGYFNRSMTIDNSALTSATIRQVDLYFYKCERKTCSSEKERGKKSETVFH